MSKYIGTPVVSLSTDTVDVTGDITTTDATPEVIIVNDTHEDTDGGREGKVTFKGQQSGGEETTLAQIQASHDGTSDDEKGDLIFKTNDGSDGASPTERLKIDSTGNVGVSGSTKTTALSSAAHFDTLGLTVDDNTAYNNVGVGGGIAFRGKRNSSGTQTVFGAIDVGKESAANDSYTGSLRFYTNNNSTGIPTEQMRLNSSGTLQIGSDTNSGYGPLQIGSTSSTPTILQMLSSTSGNNSIHFGDGTSGGARYRGYVQYGHADDALQFGTAESERMRITSAGDVGIGSTGSTSYKFIVLASGNQTTQLNYNSNASMSQDLHAWDSIRAGSSAFNFGRWRSNVGGSVDSEFIFNGAGTANADGSWNGGGADYAEYFEWKDGNSGGEDRVGITVKLDENKIVAATSDDDTSLIIGAISARPAVIGDTAWNKWKDKYETDDYARYIREEYTVTEWTIPEVKDDQGNITSEEVKHSYQTDLIPSNLTAPDNATVISQDGNGDKLTRRKLNSSFDDSVAYVSREERPEWDTVGMMGKLRIRKGQPTGDRWIKMRDVSDTVEEWLIR